MVITFLFIITKTDEFHKKPGITMLKYNKGSVFSERANSLNFIIKRGLKSLGVCVGTNYFFCGRIWVF